MEDPKVLERMRADWNERAAEDANYYVAFGRRDQDEEGFFATASQLVKGLEWDLPRLPGRDAALEIGCGPGRLLKPMSRHFREIHGVDVSDSMVQLAKQRLRGTPNAFPHHNSGSDLSMFPDGKFDYVYSYAVFQHIPSREVVFQYLRETRRVLKAGGIVHCQINGLPPDAKQYDTWNGVRISADEVRQFTKENDFQLLALEQIRTQYMWMTARKRPAGWVKGLEQRGTDGSADAPQEARLEHRGTDGSVHAPQNARLEQRGTDGSVHAPQSARLEQRGTDGSVHAPQSARLGTDSSVPGIRSMSNALTSEAVAPASGPMAAISLWIERLPDECDINHLTVTADGQACRPEYIGPPANDGVQQLNAWLPDGIRSGVVPVEVRWLGRHLCGPSWLRIIPPGPSVARITTVTDGVNLLLDHRSNSGSLKVNMIEVQDAADFHATVDGRDVRELDSFLADPVIRRWEFNFHFPEGTGSGPHTLSIRLGKRTFPAIGFEVA